MSDNCVFIHGTFKNEIKNRFLCSVCINGEDTICYIPSSCRLSNFLDLTNRTVLLKPVSTRKARTSYAVYAVKHGRGYILLNLSQANQVIEEQLHRKYFSFLGERKTISREIMVGGYKADLLVHDTNTVIEVKSLIAFERNAVFPTVYSERAVKQLCEISKLLDEGYRACYMLVSLNPYVRSIYINRDSEYFYQLFMKCINKGMTYRGLSIRLVNEKPELYSRINLCL